MTVLRRLDHFLLSSPLGKTLLVGRIPLIRLVVCGTLYGVRRSELVQAAGADVAAAATARDYLALLEQEGLTDGGGVP